MIFEDLDICINSMNEIRELEQSSEDSQRQEKLENAFRNSIGETVNMVNAIQKGYVDFAFRISVEQKQRLLRLLKEYERCMNNQKLQEEKVEYIKKEYNMVKKEILKEWDKLYLEFSLPVIKMLNNVKKIADDQSSITYAINKIMGGKNWDFKIEIIDRMQKGRDEADKIIRSLGLREEVSVFLEKVSFGNATLSDLGPGVIEWIKEKNMSGRLMISFK